MDPSNIQGNVMNNLFPQGGQQNNQPFFGGMQPQQMPQQAMQQPQQPMQQPFAFTPQMFAATDTQFPMMQTQAPNLANYYSQQQAANTPPAQQQAQQPQHQGMTAAQYIRNLFSGNPYNN